MKNSFFLVAATVVSSFFFSAQQLCAQDLAEGIVAITSPEQQQPSLNGNGQTNYTVNFNAGQQPAQFKGFNAFVANHLEYPELARANSIEGRVEVMLTISAQGKIISSQIVKSLGFGCDEAAMATIKAMPDWTPALNSDIPVKSKKIVAIDFRLR